MTSQRKGNKKNTQTGKNPKPNKYAISLIGSFTEVDARDQRIDITSTAFTKNQIRDKKHHINRLLCIILFIT